MQEVFFCNSGCEANEAATMKLAHMYGHKQGIEAPTNWVRAAPRAHSETLRHGNRKVQAGFEPLVQRLRARALQRP